MIKTLKNKIKKPTLDGILNGFNKTIAELETFRSASLAEVDKLHGKAAYYRSLASDHTTKAATRLHEADDARHVANKIKALIS
jgi:hypothetical protein